MDLDSKTEANGEIPSITKLEVVDASTPLPPPPPPCLGKRRHNRKSSYVWDHFTIIGDPEAEDVRCACNYCGQDYACGTKKCGTSTLMNHLTTRCKHYLGGVENKRQKDQTEGAGSNLLAVDVNNEATRLACAKMIVLDELPFSFVNGQGFRQFLNVACPTFDPPSCSTIVRDIYQLYLDEKLKLKKILQHQRVSLTTETWSSAQNINYMSIAAHYVDSNWKLHKWMLNFSVIANHEGETIGKAIESCLREWGIKKVFSITIDIASASDMAISYIKKKMASWGNEVCVLDGEYLQVRCFAHMIKLIVCEQLKKEQDSIVGIRNSIKYVKSSPATERRFKECVRLEKIDSKPLLFLDLPTRWDSTYLMMESALKFQKAFRRLEKDDAEYVSYFHENDGRKRLGPRTYFDWEKVSAFVKVLKVFYEITLKFSTSLHVSSTVYLHEVCSLVSELEKLGSSELGSSDDYILSHMATGAKIKFDEYWGDIHKSNQLLFIATVLDPRFKLEYAEFCFNDTCYDDDCLIIARNMTDNLKNSIMSIYDWYVKSDASPESSQACIGMNSPCELSTSSTASGRITRFMRMQAAKAAKKADKNNDVEKYLSDTLEDIRWKDFDVLSWWRVNGSKYGTLNKLVRDVMAIQVSRVLDVMDSESAFTTGERVLDQFRSSLSPRMVEVLACTKNWLKDSPSRDGLYMEDVEECDKLDEELSELLKSHEGLIQDLSDFSRML